MTRRWAPVLAVLGMLVTVMGIYSPAQAQTSDFGYTLSIKGGYGTSEVSVAVADGTRPVSLTGNIASSYTTRGTIDVLINGQRRASAPAIGGGPIKVDLVAKDVEQGHVIVGLRAALRPDQDCLRDDQAVATLEDPRLVVTGRVVPPTTLAEFLAAGPSRYVVQVPAAPTPAEQAAGLDAALALRHLYGETVDISLTMDAPSTDSSARVVTVEETQDPDNSLSIADAVLFVRGPAEALEQAAVSLADPNVGLLEVTSVDTVSGQAQYAPLEGTASLRAAGIESLAVTGIGSVTQTVTLTQATFGRPVSGLVFDFVGASTPVLQGQQGRVNITWNGDLITSETLTEDSRVNLRFSIAEENLRAVNALDVQLEYLPAGGDCSITPLPGTVEFDTLRSTVTPDFGESAAPGFQRFPQVLPAQIPVAAGGALAQSLPELAQVLTGVTAPSPLQYTVALTDVSDLMDTAGVATGVSAPQATLLSAPLSDDPDFPAGKREPYAALQAYQANGHDMLILTGVAPASSTLAEWPVAQPGGWASLEGQTYVLATDQTQPEAFQTSSTQPDKQKPQIIVGSAVSLALLLVLIIWLRRRPKQG